MHKFSRIEDVVATVHYLPLTQGLVSARFLNIYLPYLRFQRLELMVAAASDRECEDAVHVIEIIDLFAGQSVQVLDSKLRVFAFYIVNRLFYFSCENMLFIVCICQNVAKARGQSFSELPCEPERRTFSLLIFLGLLQNCLH